MMSDSYQVELLHNSWNRCWSIMASQQNDILRDVIIWKYSDPRRYYHNISHLIGCIHELKHALTHIQVQNPLLLELALWIHDIENEVTPLHIPNETASILFFVEMSKQYPLYFGYTEDFNNKLYSLSQLVMSTTHTLSNTDSIEHKLICDIDLVTLGSDETAFSSYCSKIRKEYVMYTDTEYYSGRLKILSGFLNRGFIYRTEYYKDTYESVAIHNLSNEIKRIEGILNGIES